jgi:hypothetical protein
MHRAGSAATGKPAAVFVIFLEIFAVLRIIGKNSHSVSTGKLCGEIYHIIKVDAPMIIDAVAHGTYRIVRSRWPGIHGLSTIGYGLLSMRYRQKFFFTGISFNNFTLH